MENRAAKDKYKNKTTIQRCKRDKKIIILIPFIPFFGIHLNLISTSLPVSSNNQDADFSSIFSKSKSLHYDLFGEGGDYVIEIISAEHLDSNRNFIPDISVRPVEDMRLFKPFCLPETQDLEMVKC